MRILILDGSITEGMTRDMIRHMDFVGYARTDGTFNIIKCRFFEVNPDEIIAKEIFIKALNLAFKEAATRIALEANQVHTGDYRIKTNPIKRDPWISAGPVSTDINKYDRSLSDMIWKEHTENFYKK
jgi:hypothetical protein